MPRATGDVAGVGLADCIRGRDRIDSLVMSEAIAFDTYKFVKRLTAHGFTEEQAEVLAAEQVNLLNSNLATKADIEALRQATKVDIEALRQATKVDIAGIRREIETLKVDLLKWLFGALIAQGGLIVALVKLL